VQRRRRDRENFLYDFKAAFRRGRLRAARCARRARRPTPRATSTRSDQLMRRTSDRRGSCSSGRSTASRGPLARRASFGADALLLTPPPASADGPVKDAGQALPTQGRPPGRHGAAAPPKSPYARARLPRISPEAAANARKVPATDVRACPALSGAQQRQNPRQDRETPAGPARGFRWWEKDSNLRRLSQRVYSPSPLTARESHRAAASLAPNRIAVRGAACTDRRGRWRARSRA
jgi:hypothetical protein